MCRLYDDCRVAWSLDFWAEFSLSFDFCGNLCGIFRILFILSCEAVGLLNSRSHLWQFAVVAVDVPPKIARWKHELATLFLITFLDGSGVFPQNPKFLTFLWGHSQIRNYVEVFDKMKRTCKWIDFAVLGMLRPNILQLLSWRPYLITNACHCFGRFWLGTGISTVKFCAVIFANL